MTHGSYPTDSKKKCYEDCTKRTKFPCANKGCTKMACQEHSAAICESCIKNTPEKRTVTTNYKATKRENCFLHEFCKSYINSRCAISECYQMACNNHRHRICYWCCSLNNIDAVFLGRTNLRIRGGAYKDGPENFGQL